MDIKNSMLLANMMSKSGGGNVEFKTYCYALNNGYIFLDNIQYNGIRVVGKLLDTSYNTLGNQYNVQFYSLVGTTRYSSEPSQWRACRLQFTKNSYTKSVSIGYASGSNSISLQQEDGTIDATDFDIEKKNLGEALLGCGILCYYRIYNNSFDQYLNDKAKVERIVLYNGDTEVANLVPAIVNGESGMYDTVTETFYGNANSVGSLVCE